MFVVKLEPGIEAFAVEISPIMSAVITNHASENEICSNCCSLSNFHQLRKINLGWNKIVEQLKIIFFNIAVQISILKAHCINLRHFEQPLSVDSQGYFTDLTHFLFSTLDVRLAVILNNPCKHFAKCLVFLACRFG